MTALKVTRYRPYYIDPTTLTAHAATMRENTGGDYVRYEDYEKQLSAALQYKHELEEAQAEIARMREARRERLSSLIPETSRE